jgi:hypothetical protein
MFGVYNDLDWNRLDLYNVSEVLTHPFYQSDLVDSFDNEFGTGCGDKMVKCAATCSKKGQEIRPIAKHKYENHNVVN